MLAIMTDDVRFFFDVANDLKERGIPFLSIPVGGEIPATVKVMITTDKEAPAIDFFNVVHHQDPHVCIVKALATMSDRDTCKRMVIGIDPGPYPGLAVLGDGVFLMAKRIDDINEIADEVKAVIENLDADQYEINIGHQDETNRNRIINMLWPIGITINVVQEDGTTINNSHQPNIDAAKLIARMSGKALNWPPAVDPTHDELREVQRQSRIKSGGKATISMELALLVAKGEMTMEEALRVTIDKGRQRMI